MRRAAKIDNNQNDIVEGLSKLLGITVQRGHNDILVGYRGRTYWYEIKSDQAVSRKTGKILEKQKQKSQKTLEATWTGHYRIVSSLSEILDEIYS